MLYNKLNNHVKSRCEVGEWKIIDCCDTIDDRTMWKTSRQCWHAEPTPNTQRI